MKICHVITRMIVGGAQENTLLTVRYQSETGHRVTLISGDSPGREGKLLDNVRESADFELKIFPDLVREISPWRDWRAYCRLKRFFREEKFDVVHTHSSKAGIIGRLAARAAGVPVVVHTVHGQAFHPYQSRWRNRVFIALERAAAKVSDRIYAVAQAMIDQCVQAGVAPAAKYRVVYSGMEIERFTGAVRDPALRRQLGLPEQAPTVASVARLFPQKGYEYILPAAEILLKKVPDLHFLFIGDGPMYDELHRRLTAAGIAEHFHFAGLVAPERVADYLVQADLLWHFSLHEGLPRAAVQALATGIPVIGFHLDGTPEVVLNGRTGFTVPAEAVEEAAAKSLELLTSPELAAACGRNGRELVREKFHWRRMGEILTADYEALLAAKKGGK